MLKSLAAEFYDTDITAVFFWNMSMKRVIKGIILMFIPVILYLLLYIGSDRIIKLSEGFGACIIYEEYGILCPGCGNTRSVKALLGGHFFKALKYNITIPSAAFLFLFYYYVWVLRGMGIKIKKRIKREYVVSGFILFLAVYYVLRNIRL